MKSQKHYELQARALAVHLERTKRLSISEDEARTCLAVMHGHESWDRFCKDVAKKRWTGLVGRISTGAVQEPQDSSKLQVQQNLACPSKSDVEPEQAQASTSRMKSALVVGTLSTSVIESALVHRGGRGLVLALGLEPRTIAHLASKGLIAKSAKAPGYVTHGVRAHEREIREQWLLNRLSDYCNEVGPSTGHVVVITGASRLNHQGIQEAVNRVSALGWQCWVQFDSVGSLVRVCPSQAALKSLLGAFTHVVGAGLVLERERLGARAVLGLVAPEGARATCMRDNKDGAPTRPLRIIDLASG